MSNEKHRRKHRGGGHECRSLSSPGLDPCAQSGAPKGRSWREVPKSEGVGPINEESTQAVRPVEKSKHGRLLKLKRNRTHPVLSVPSEIKTFFNYRTDPFTPCPPITCL